MSAMETQRFPFGPRGAALFLAASFFAACGAVFLHVASTRGPMGEPVPVFSANGVLLYLFTALVFGIVALTFVAYVTHRMKGHRELVIEPDAFEVPRNVWATGSQRVERADVLRYGVQQVMGTKIVGVYTEYGAVHVSNRTVGEDGFQALLSWLEGP